VAHAVLRHRIVTTFQADSQGLGTDDIIDMLIEHVPNQLKVQAQEAAKG